MSLPDAPAVRPTAPDLDALATALCRLLLQAYRRRIEGEAARGGRENPAIPGLAGTAGPRGEEAARD